MFGGVNKLLIVGLCIVNVILFGVCAFFFMKMDKVAPEFTFSDTDAVYVEGMDYSKMVVGINAYDNVDGDVSDRIVVEKIVGNSDTDTAVVYYAVSDLSANFAKTSRRFKAVFDNSNTMYAGIENDLSVGDLEKAKKESQENTEAEVTETKTETETETEAETETEETTVEEETVKESEQTVEEPKKEEKKEEPKKEEPKKEEKKEEPKKEEPKTQETPSNSGAPYIVMNGSDFTVPLGSRPAWTALLKTMSDDKDNYETLFKNVKCTGYDVNKAGTYTATIYTVDSDGNKSNVCTFTLHVK
ncbi:MAG: hypothetical protein K5662_05990 [Lachnospiraceae bacterium]|nr:hypothetical protein [Lachnospiraceae bacterium]